MKSHAEPRMVAYVGLDTYVPGHGYRVSFVKEGETGHFPTGNWPYGGGAGQTMPWFWGPSLGEALTAMDEYNRSLGIAPEEASKIIQASILGQFSSARGRPLRAKSHR